MRSAVHALVACGLAGLSCSPAVSPSCPGETVGTFHFVGTLVPADPNKADDPAKGLLDCTPDPEDTTAPVRYPKELPAFDAKLAANPGNSDAALCRSNGVIYAGATGPSGYSVSAEADPAILCDGVCAAGLRIVIQGIVTVGTDGAPTGFEGYLVEMLTASRGACDGCLPSVPSSDPPRLACAGRYTLTGTPR